MSPSEGRRSARSRRPQVEPRQIERLQIERLVAGGEGLARADDGRVVFVPGTLPGETVDVRLVTAKRDYARGEVLRVVEPAPVRRDPPCAALARGCGGCDWQHADAEAQVPWKADIVREALRRTARLPDAEVWVGGAVPPWGYRTSMRFTTDRHGRLSLRRSRSHDDVTIDQCHVAHPRLSELLEHVVVPGADEVSLRVSVASGEATAWWDPAGAVPARCAEHLAVGTDASLVEQVEGHAIRVSARSFFQSGPAAAELLVHTVREMGGSQLADATHVVDAYGGIGLFAVASVPRTARVTVVEHSAPAGADAKVNLVDRDATVIIATVEAWAAERTGRDVDVIIADPSRQGLGAEATSSLAAIGAPMLLLVSCDPVAMARDTMLLSTAGYRHDGTAVLDLFPQTHHVEAVTRFVRSASSTRPVAP